MTSWHKGIDNQGNSPIQYAFDLLATGQAQSPTPKSRIDVPKQPLTLQIRTWYILYTAAMGTADDTTWKGYKFWYIFMDSSYFIVLDINYSFKVANSNGSTIKDFNYDN